MAHYLRDQHVHDLSINEQALSQISNLFTERYQHLIDELTAQGKTAFFTYIIRFDNKGYRVFTLNELIRYFNQAENVERVIFTIESDAAIQSNRAIGAYLELCLDGLSIYCPQCRKNYESVTRTQFDADRNGRYSTWTEDWRCTAGHIVHSKKNEIRYFKPRNGTNSDSSWLLGKGVE